MSRLIKFYELSFEEIKNTPTWIVNELARMMPVIQAEEQLEMAMVLRLFANTAMDKKSASELKSQQRRYIRAKKKIVDGERKANRSSAQKPVHKINPSDLSSDKKDKLRDWAKSQGFDVDDKDK